MEKRSKFKLEAPTAESTESAGARQLQNPPQLALRAERATPAAAAATGSIPKVYWAKTRHSMRLV